MLKPLKLVREFVFRLIQALPRNLYRWALKSEREFHKKTLSVEARIFDLIRNLGNHEFHSPVFLVSLFEKRKFPGHRVRNEGCRTGSLVIVFLCCVLSAAFILPRPAHSAKTVSFHNRGESAMVNISRKDINLIKFPTEEVKVFTKSRDVDVRVSGKNVMVSYTGAEEENPEIAALLFATPGGSYSMLLRLAGTPCDRYSPEYRQDQIFAGCKDYYQWYKVPIGSGTDVDDCECWNHGGAYCSTPPLFEVTGSPPEGAVYLGTSFENFRDRGKRSGWDQCTSDRYNWYVKYDKSVIERLFLQKDSPCGDNLARWAQECTVSRLEQCDPAGGNCVVSIENSEDTGLMPDFDYLTKVLQGVVTASPSSPCTYDYYYEAEDMVWYWTCPASWCLSGSCPAGALEKSSASGSSVKIEKPRPTPTWTRMPILPRSWFMTNTFTIKTPVFARTSRVSRQLSDLSQGLYHRF